MNTTASNGTIVEALSNDTYLITSNELTDTSTAWVTFPAVGDTARDEAQFSSKGNVVKDSQELARRLGIAILVSSRPPVGKITVAPVSKQALKIRYNDQAARQAEALASTTDECGISVVNVFAESLGALHGLAVVRSGILPVERMGVWDPVGWLNINTLKAAPYYGRYIFGGGQEKFIAEHPDATGSGPEWYQPTRFKKTFGAIRMVGRQARDSATNARVLASDISLSNALYVRDHLPHIAGLIVSPESSFSMPTEVIDKPAILDELRTKPGTPRAAQWLIREAIGRCHDSINSMDTRTAFIEDIQAL